jgi:T4 RnlA family RNA ligase
MFFGFVCKKRGYLFKMTLPFDLQSLPDLIERGYLISQVHPTLPLTIYNYSQQTQFEGYWTPVTLQCRGLVVGLISGGESSEERVVGRPLPKFFNLGERGETLPEGLPKVYEKLDGSLIILFFYQEEWVVASRGSFNSEQALKATALLANYSEAIESLDPTYTYLFEVIYPENRIVVNYDLAERLVFLAAIETATGNELPDELVTWPDRANIYPVTDLSIWLKSAETNPEIFDDREGFILKWPNGFRLKYKLAEYVRLHRVLTQIQAKDIWECLSQDRSLNEFLEMVPDEFYQWVKATKADLEEKYREIELECQQAFKVCPTRKESAAYFQTQKYPKVLFLMLDDRDCSQVIWRAIKPPFQRPFRVDSPEG